MRNWKCVPSGIDSAVPGTSDTISARWPWRRHISPSPCSTYHSSSTVRWVTASEQAPGRRRQCTMLPPGRLGSSRISEPSGASVSASPATRRVAKGCVMAGSEGCRRDRSAAAPELEPAGRRLKLGREAKLRRRSRGRRHRARPPSAGAAGRGRRAVPGGPRRRRPAGARRRPGSAAWRPAGRPPTRERHGSSSSARKASFRFSAQKRRSCVGASNGRRISRTKPARPVAVVASMLSAGPSRSAFRPPVATRRCARPTMNSQVGASQGWHSSRIRPHRACSGTGALWTMPSTARSTKFQTRRAGRLIPCSALAGCGREAPSIARRSR